MEREMEYCLGVGEKLVEIGWQVVEIRGKRAE